MTLTSAECLRSQRTYGHNMDSRWTPDGRVDAYWVPVMMARNAGSPTWSVSTLASRNVMRLSSARSIRDRPGLTSNPAFSLESDNSIVLNRALPA